MSDLTAIAAAATPTFAVLLGVLYNNRQLERMEDRLTRRIDNLETRMLGLEQRMLAGFERVNADLIRFFQITGELKGRLDERTGK